MVFFLVAGGGEAGGERQAAQGICQARQRLLRLADGEQAADDGGIRHPGGAARRHRNQGEWPMNEFRDQSKDS